MITLNPQALAALDSLGLKTARPVYTSSIGARRRPAAPLSAAKLARFEAGIRAGIAFSHGCVGRLIKRPTGSGGARTEWAMRRIIP